MELIKLKFKPELSTAEESQGIVDSFIQSCVNLNTTILEPILEEDCVYDDREKYEFLAFLKAQFDSAKKIGLRKMIVKQGRCTLCISGHISYEFYGQANRPRFAYVIELENRRVKNIFNCNASSGWFK
ncbi:hypothetical protein ACFSQJ_19310 [Croceitalea marina]|uniref:SnoaL-like domain-containing protein n=1 Tax=Croceitalea marina TaxID=1775166 RepID=A0ABW5N0S7_9FLAO